MLPFSPPSLYSRPHVEWTMLSALRPNEACTLNLEDSFFFFSVLFLSFVSPRLLFLNFFSFFWFPSVSYSNFCLSFFLCSLTFYLISYSVSPMQVIYLNKTPEEAFRLLTSGNSPTFLPFRYVYDFNDFHFCFSLSNLLKQNSNLNYSLIQQRCFVRLGRI